MTLLSHIEIQALINSTIITIGSSLIAIFIALVCNLILIHNKKFNLIISLIMLIALLIPPFFHAVGWANLINYLANKVFENYGILMLLRSMPGVIFVLGISYSPLAFFIINRQLNQIPISQIDAVKLLPHTNSKLIQLIVKDIKSILLITFILIGLLTFNSFDVSAFYEVNSFPTVIFSQFSAHFDYLRAFILSLIPVIITVFGCIVLFKSYTKQPLFNLSISKSELPQIILPKVIKIILYLLSFIFLIFLILPSFSIFIGSNIFSTNGIQEIIGNFSVIRNSINITFLSVLLIFIPLGLSYFYIQYPLIRYLSLASFIIPSVTFGVIVSYFSNLIHLNSSSLIPLLGAYILRIFPIIAEIMYQRNLSFNPSQLQAAQLMTSRKKQILTQIYFPFFRSEILFSIIILVWLVITELPITLLLQPAGMQTMINRVFILLHYGSETTMNVLLLLMIILGFGFIFISKKLLKDHHENH